MLNMKCCPLQCLMHMAILATSIGPCLDERFPSKRSFRPASQEMKSLRPDQGDCLAQLDQRFQLLFLF
jgi:hypothetical protein